VLEAIPQSYSSSFKNSKGIQLPADKRPGFPANYKKGRIRVEDATTLASKRVSCILEENKPISSIKITDISS
jgi:hypothetical protein